MINSPTKRPNNWRRAGQMLPAGLYLATPFLSIDNVSLLRFDFVNGFLDLFGMRLRVDQLILFNLALLMGLLTLLWLSASLGRLWCGWGCPQSFFADAAGRLEKSLRRLPIYLRIPILHLCLFLFSGIFAGATILYFIYPGDLISPGFINSFPITAASTAMIWAALYLNLAFVRRYFCKLVCPYGKFLAVVGDADALGVEMIPQTADNCIQCRACVRICPIGLDIRQGAGGDCIVCGRCIEACADVMEKRGEATLIHFHSGGTALWKAVFGPRRAPLLIAIVAAGLLFGGLAANRTDAVFRVRLNRRAPYRLLEDGRTAVFLDAVIGNRSNEIKEFSLTIKGAPGIELRGAAVPVVVEPQSTKRLSPVAVAPSGLLKNKREVVLILRSNSDGKAIESKITLPSAGAR